MTDISIRSSLLPSYPDCPRMFVAKYALEKKIDLGSGLKPTRRNIGAVIGTATHDAHAYLMNALARTGDHGGTTRRDHAVDVAMGSYQKSSQESGGIGMDGTTPNQRCAEETIRRITRRMYLDHRPDSEPVYVEKGFSTEYGYRSGRRVYSVKVTGTVDLYLFGGKLPDIKTGRNRPLPYIQLGTYANILTGNGVPVNDLECLYFKRVALRTPQPTMERIPIDINTSTHASKAVAKRAHVDLKSVLQSGDPNRVVARPESFLCDPRFCPAFDTEFCKIGAIVNRHKRDWRKKG